MGVLDRNAHLLEHGDCATPEVGSQTLRRVIEVAGLIHWNGRLARLHRVLEEEELHLGMGVEGESQIGGSLERAFQHITGVGVRRRAVRHRDVAKHPGCSRTGVTPGQHLEGRGVRMGEHVGLIHPCEALNR